MPLPGDTRQGALRLPSAVVGGASAPAATAGGLAAVTVRAEQPGVLRPGRARIFETTRTQMREAVLMPTLSESIEATVPLKFANREWGKYMARQFYDRRSGSDEEISDEFDDGIVKFEPAGEALTKVTVELNVQPPPGSDAEADLARARERVASVLKGYRTYVLRRCDQTQCRNN
jgi:hypothetical protein